LAYAKERVQGRDVLSRQPQQVAIVRHPDVRRMLMWMKAHVEAMRALATVAAAAIDCGNRSFADFMTPIVKGWCTETATDLCSTAVQVFGGMGYIEETGIAQHYRDIKIASIYEGTTGIQALDLVNRKLLRDHGATAASIVSEMMTFARSMPDDDGDLTAIRIELEKGLRAISVVSRWIEDTATTDLAGAVSCSVPYLKLWGITAGGWQMARAATIAAARIADRDPGSDFYRAKLTTARFYADHIQSQAAWLQHQIVHGSGDVMRLSPAELELDRGVRASI
jgi:acyl-CoA dehydrogenase